MRSNTLLCLIADFGEDLGSSEVGGFLCDQGRSGGRRGHAGPLGRHVLAPTAYVIGSGGCEGAGFGPVDHDLALADKPLAVHFDKRI
jgi:hypothetical protein